MNSVIKLLFVVFIIIRCLSQYADANRGFINGTNYKCNDDGNLIELPDHLRKPCILCICSKGFVKCEKLNQCQGNRPDRKRRSIRCIEEECCDLVEDVFLNNVDGSNKLVTYRTLEESTRSEINNQIRTSSIRYVHCPSDLIRNNNQMNRFSKLLNSKSNSPRSTMNTRSVTSQPNMDNLKVCTLSSHLNSDTSKYRQYITTFDEMRMRLRYKDHCHFVFARDCAPEQSFTIHLLYSGNQANANKSLTTTTNNKSTNRSAQFAGDLVSLTTASNELDGKSTSNYTQRYLSALKQSKTSSKELLSIFIRIGKRKIRLDSNLNVKLDGHPILLPYMHRGIKIVYYRNHIILNSDIGLKLVWSGLQELVVSLPRHFQGRTCGLCGNFNGDLTDDLKNRKGQLVQSQLRFIQSWVTGKNRQCLISSKYTKAIANEKSNNNLVRNSLASSPSSPPSSNSTCKYTFKRKMKATRFCNSLKINIPFECLKHLGIENYYEDCLQRMCPCNRKSCNCEILSSYVDKCSKVLTNRTHQFSMTASFENECPNFNQFSDTSASQPNTNLNQSRTARTLDALRTDKRYELDKLQECPDGSVFSQCAPIDKVTCSDLLPRSDYSNRLPEHLDTCQPGCKCQSYMVWSDDFSKCISIDNCSSLSLNLRKRTVGLLNRPKLTLN